MKRSLLLLAIAFVLHSSISHAQKITEKQWNFDAGPYIGLPAWSFAATHSLGFGLDAKETIPFGSGFSGGGEIAFAHFLGKTAGTTKIHGFNMTGIYANLQYVYLDKYVAGGDLGLGFGFSGGAAAFAFARTGYLGYQLQAAQHLITLALYLNRTTPATYNIGIKSWYRF